MDLQTQQPLSILIDVKTNSVPEANVFKQTHHCVNQIQSIILRRSIHLNSIQLHSIHAYTDNSNV